MSKRTTVCLAAILSTAVFSVLTNADTPTTAPATPQIESVASDSPAQAEVRAAVLHYDFDCFTETLAESRARIHTASDADNEYADYTAHEHLLANRLEKAVRDKWGAAGDAEFCAVTGGTTYEQDLAAEVTVDGDHATVNFPDDAKKAPARLAKIDGKWVTDYPTIFKELREKNPQFDHRRYYRGPVFKELTENLAAGKYDDEDAFLADLKEKLSDVRVTSTDD